MEYSTGKRPNLGRLAIVSALVFAIGVGGIGSNVFSPISVVARAQTAGGAADATTMPYEHQVPAPPLEGGEWVNTPKPLALADFRGRFVLLDFWTFCCINCMHILPELKKLEHAFPNELVVVGIHSAKFQGERVTDNIREAVLRYEIEHPVVNDAKMTIWNTYGAHSWPTLVLIDPEGNVVWASSGERDFEELKAVIDRGLPYYRAKGLLKPGPRPAIIGPSRQTATPLLFPGKILADEKGGRLFIADSNHNRIVLAKLDGKDRRDEPAGSPGGASHRDEPAGSQAVLTIGSGAIGNADGSFEACSFNHPQGMALLGDALYIADTENHLLRKADLAKRTVVTIAGTGEKGSAWADVIAGEGAGKHKLRTTPLSSPWALWVHRQDLYIAMAGMHQIWRMPLDESAIGPYAGNAREDIENGPLLPKAPYDTGFASFAQPSGLSSDGNRLYVADSEGSTVRSVPFDLKGNVETLVGLTGTLFDFGDKDGTGRDVRLQHPLDVCWYNGHLYVTDTYNNKIKVIDVEKRSCRTLAGSGQRGSADAAEGARATFTEPAGISAAGGKLYVADTNNHAIRVVDLSGTNRVSTLKIDGLAAPVQR